MGVPREDLLLMTRALKRGLADLKAIRKALDRQVSKPISFLEALHLPASDAQMLRADPASPDPHQDRPLLESLRAMLLEGEDLTPGEWEQFVASVARPTQRHVHPPLPVPQEFDGYALQWELARRERGVVYRARDGAGRDVAIKVFRKDVPLKGEMPRVDGHPYAVMPFIDGESLEAKKPGSPRRAVQVIEAAAHLLRGAPHGALTPARILVRKNDSVVVIGFEHARAVPLSSRGQAYGGGDDARALGAILYELLTGSAPQCETSPAARSRDVEPDLDRIVSGALQGFYPSVSELADDLGRVLRGEPVTARRSPAIAGRKGKKPWAIAAAAGVLIAAMIAALVLSNRSRPAEVRAPAPVDEPKPVVQSPAPAPEPPRPKPVPKSEGPKTAAAKPLTPEEDEGLFQAGLQASFSADWERVLAIGNEAISRGSRKEWAYHLATAYAERDELDKALEYATRALDASAEKGLALEKRAEVYVLRGDVKKAIADLELLNGKKVMEYNRRIDRLKKLVNADPKDARSRLQLGVYHFLRRYFDTAEEDFTGALELGRKSALVWRAVARQSRGNREGAIEDLKAYRAALPTGYATDEVTAILKDLGAN